ncbi:efflux RND transporter permease subunit, partial [Pseudomonas aeruginosa]|nr:efflux RND transporter permease subunit [Pseudomonas aeruginosa]
GTNYVGQKVIARLRKTLGGRVLSAPIEQLERYRTHRLIPVLTHDIDTVSDHAFGLPQLVISLTVTLGCLGYLATLSLPMFLVAASAVVLGTIALSVWLYISIPKTFFPEQDTGVLMGGIQADQSISFQA